MESPHTFSSVFEGLRKEDGNIESSLYNETLSKKTDEKNVWEGRKRRIERKLMRPLSS